MFDDPGVLAAAKHDPNGFIAGLNTPVTLDEVQHAVGKRWVRGVVLYTRTQVIPFASNLHGLPLSHLWTLHKISECSSCFLSQDREAQNL